MTDKVVVMDPEKLAALIKDIMDKNKDSVENAATESVASDMKAQGKENLTYPSQTWMSQAEQKAIDAGEEFLDSAIDIIFGEKPCSEIQGVCDAYMSTIEGQASIEGLISMLQTFASMATVAATNNVQHLTGLLCCPPGHLKETMQSELINKSYTKCFQTMIISLMMMTAADSLVHDVVKGLMKHE